ncbi:hypothetical protein B0G74_8837 [Paraburkholderia sp. BL9I2N2]|nr:hypothetical protein B0G74_8837 [Paraburkholderia sp. BL9I2N2]
MRAREIKYLNSGSRLSPGEANVPLPRIEPQRYKYQSSPAEKHACLPHANCRKPGVPQPFDQALEAGAQTSAHDPWFFVAAIPPT